MFDWILNFLLQTLIGLFWGIILLLVALFVLPEKIFLSIVKFFKKDLVSKSVIVNKVKIIFDYIFNLKGIVISDLIGRESSEFEKEIKNLLEEKRKYEGNLFFLDLLKGYSNMLLFSILNVGYGVETAFAIMSRSLEYLQYYSHQLNPTKNMMDQKERIQIASYKLEQVINSFEEIEDFNDKLNLQKIKSSLKNGTTEFDTFIKEEYDRTKEQLNMNNQKLVDKLILILEKNDY